MSKRKDHSEELVKSVRPSIAVRLVRHAESRNNEIYRDARHLYRGGTPDFDFVGWRDYVDTHRSEDPALSTIGYQQADRLADFLVEHLCNQASSPVRFVVSPMRRTLETIRPTLHRIEQSNEHSAEIVVHGFYFESEGCHVKDKPVEGMHEEQIRELLATGGAQPSTVSFEGFPIAGRGWYAQGTGAETRAESEARAAKFYLWLCENLDAQLSHPDVFDAGVTLPHEATEDEHDRFAPRARRRRTVVLVGHGDFMSLVLKRIVSGFGHFVENEGIPHRSAFTHYNTGITELEYFGKGRFLVMSHNQTPHIPTEEYSALRTGGSLKDGWSYLMPGDEVFLNAEVSVAFSDELDESIREQTNALRALYMSSAGTSVLKDDATLSIDSSVHSNDRTKQFIVKKGLQVLAVASYSEERGIVSNVAVRPSAGQEACETLFKAVKDHSTKLGRSGSLLVMPRSGIDKEIFDRLGFEEAESYSLTLEREQR